MKKLLMSLAAFAYVGGVAVAATIPALPYTLVNGTPTDANKVMANFNQLQTYLDALYTAVVTPGTYGDATNVPQITLNSRGQVTGVVAVPIISVVPVGAVVPYAGASAPTNWKLAYGETASRTGCAALFSAIGTTYGIGDGSTTFNLPDLRGRAAFGKDNMGGSGASRLTSGGSGVDGATLGAVGGDQLMQSHAHGVTDPGHYHLQTGSNNFEVTGSGGAAGPLNTDYEGQTEVGFTGISIQSTGGGSSQNVPPAMVLNYIIYAAC